MRLTPASYSRPAGPRTWARALTTLACLVAVATVEAHHGSADYDVDREIAVTGIVREWRWSNPHTWVYVTIADGAGRGEWSGEGPPLTWAEARGWSKSTLTAGERVTLHMYPSRRDRRSGLVKRIQRASGEVLLVSRPWLDR
jgi:hypothetical protein